MPGIPPYPASDFPSTPTAIVTGAASLRGSAGRPRIGSPGTDGRWR